MRGRVLRVEWHTMSELSDQRNAPPLDSTRTGTRLWLPKTPSQGAHTERITMTAPPTSMISAAVPRCSPCLPATNAMTSRRGQTSIEGVASAKSK